MIYMYGVLLSQLLYIALVQRAKAIQYIKTKTVDFILWMKLGLSQLYIIFNCVLDFSTNGTSINALLLNEDEYRYMAH